jgi:hypothetical protein
VVHHSLTRMLGAVLLALALTQAAATSGVRSHLFDEADSACGVLVSSPRCFSFEYSFGGRALWRRGYPLADAFEGVTAPFGAHHDVEKPPDTPGRVTEASNLQAPPRLTAAVALSDTRRESGMAFVEVSLDRGELGRDAATLGWSDGEPLAASISDVACRRRPPSNQLIDGCAAHVARDASVVAQCVRASGIAATCSRLLALGRTGEAKALAGTSGLGWMFRAVSSGLRVASFWSAAFGCVHTAAVLPLPWGHAVPPARFFSTSAPVVLPRPSSVHQGTAALYHVAMGLSRDPLAVVGMLARLELRFAPIVSAALGAFQELAFPFLIQQPQAMVVGKDAPLEGLLGTSLAPADLAAPDQAVRRGHDGPLTGGARCSDPRAPDIQNGSSFALDEVLCGGHAPSEPVGAGLHHVLYADSVWRPTVTRLRASPVLQASLQRLVLGAGDSEQGATDQLVSTVSEHAIRSLTIDGGLESSNPLSPSLRTVLEDMSCIVDEDGRMPVVSPPICVRNRRDKVASNHLVWHAAGSACNLAPLSNSLAPEIPCEPLPRLTPHQRALVSLVQLAVRLAEQGVSRLPREVLVGVSGMSSALGRHMMSNLCCLSPGTRYLEVGSYVGSTLLSCSAGCPTLVESTVAVDQFSFSGPSETANIRNRFRRNLESIHGGFGPVTMVEGDGMQPSTVAAARTAMADQLYGAHRSGLRMLNASDVLVRDVPAKANLYMYDGPHSADDHRNALTVWQDVLEDEFILIVDDWNDESVREGTYAGLREANMSVLYSEQMPSRYNTDTVEWWDGYAVMVILK